MSSATDAPARPPRPQHVPDEVLDEAARRLRVKRREIAAVYDTDAGRVIETTDGNQVIDVPADCPDAAGQTGLLIYRGVIGKNTALSGYVGPHSAGQRQATDTPWTIADLDVEAARLHVPAPEYSASGPSRRPWIGNDPIRARAVWLHIASGLAVEPAQAVYRSEEAAYCKQIIVASGWLSKHEAAAL